MGVVISVVAVAAPARAENAIVERIVDGDTLDVRIGDRLERVRLLNIDAPEMTGDDGVPQCLAPEATDELSALAPVGSEIKLEYDVERHDRFDRTLAAVTRSDGVVVNTELVARGLATPMTVGRNTRWAQAVAAAEAEAQEGQSGIFDPLIACTPAALVATLDPTSAELPADLPTTSAELHALGSQVSATASTAEELALALAAFDYLPSRTLDYFAEQVAAITARASATHGVLTTRAEAAAEQEAAVAAAAAEAAARAAAEQQAREEAQRQADMAAEAARRAAESATRTPNAAAPAAPQPAPAPAPPAPPGGVSDAGYTGCRDYSGTGMIDSKGRSFAPIPCP